MSNYSKFLLSFFLFIASHAIGRLCANIMATATSYFAPFAAQFKDKNLAVYPYPNTFTPNGDGLDDAFYPKETGIKQLNAHNQWEELAFERINFNINDEHNGWYDALQASYLNQMHMYIATCESDEDIT